MAERLRYEYSPVTEREFDLPDGERVAVWVIPNVEHFEIDEQNPFSAEGLVPDVLGYGWRDYGNRVGIWRLMEIFERHDVTATVALNARVCDEEPEVVEAGVDLGWEFMGHGLTNSRPLHRYDEDEQRAVVAETRDRIARATGTTPRGWLGPGLIETFSTLDHLASEGFEYVCDWCNDDQPYPMADPSDLIAMPYSIEINDIPLVIRRNCTGPELEATITQQFDVLYEEGARPGNAKVMAISLHPFISGQPHRSKFIDNALEYIAGHDEVWLTTGGEIADYYRSTYL